MNLGVKMIKPLVLCALLLSTFMPVRADNSFEYEEALKEHEYLIDTIRSVGVQVYVNPPSCDFFKKNKDYDILGLYLNDTFRLVLCQDNFDGKGHTAKWTPNDFDTLRHEAQHVVQDCAYGEIGDGMMARMFSNMDSYKDFIKASGIPDKKVVEIYDTYMEQVDDNPYKASMEVEAYAVANSIPAQDIAEKMKEFCDAKKR